MKICESKMEEKKPMSLSFGFSKVKPKSSLVQTNTKLFDDSKSKPAPEDQIELITSLDGKKITTLHKKDDINSKKPLVIPCQKNQPVFDIAKAMEKKLAEASRDVQPNADGKPIDDLEAVRALMKESKEKSNETKESNLKIPLNEESGKDQSTLGEVEEPNYENVDLEQFGRLFFSEKIQKKFSIFVFFIRFNKFGSVALKMFLND
jgi:hypothetical protein